MYLNTRGGDDIRQRTVINDAMINVRKVEIRKGSDLIMKIGTCEREDYRADARQYSSRRSLRSLRRGRSDGISFYLKRCDL